MGSSLHPKLLLVGAECGSHADGGGRGLSSWVWQLKSMCSGRGKTCGFKSKLPGANLWATFTLAALVSGPNLVTDSERARSLARQMLLESECASSRGWMCNCGLSFWRRLMACWGRRASSCLCFPQFLHQRTILGIHPDILDYSFCAWHWGWEGGGYRVDWGGGLCSRVMSEQGSRRRHTYIDRREAVIRALSSTEEDGGVLCLTH